MDSSDTTQPPPKQVYEQRRERLRGERAELDRRDRWFATARGIVFLAGLALAYFAVIAGSVAPFWLLVPVGIFCGLVVAHAAVVRRLAHLQRAITYYDRGLDRLADRWTGIGISGQRYDDVNHPYSSDLDLFGDGSLFQLLCGSRTRLGEDTLANWLAQAADIAAVRTRQQAVIELRNNVAFREELAVLDAEVHDEFDQNRLREWVQEPPQPFTTRQRTTATVLGVLAALSLLYWISGGMISPFLTVLVAEIVFYARQMAAIRQIAMGAEHAGSGLAILGQVMQLIERQQFSSSYLAGLKSALNIEGQLPSWRINQLRNLIQNLSACLQNQFFAPLAFLLGIPIHLAHRIECWREHVGVHLPEWLDAVGAVEAVASLSGYAYEHPQDVFPEFVELANGPCFEGMELGHPLLPDSKCIRNDVRLNSEQRLLMVSGSNMSGKSTLLRTVGVNAVLAWCGAPVRATRLRISPVQIGTEMRIHDSLQQGVSLFYTAISRLKSIVELAGRTPPLLFLLDEILQGTNSHDRRVGAEAILRQLVDRGAIGLVTTHDLALTRIVASFDGRATNIHFEDHLINGRMFFDHRIRPGVVQKSNALELMRMIGLEVAEDLKTMPRD